MPCAVITEGMCASFKGLPKTPVALQNPVAGWQGKVLFLPRFSFPPALSHLIALAFVTETGASS